MWAAAGATGSASSSPRISRVTSSSAPRSSSRAATSPDAVGGAAGANAEPYQRSGLAPRASVARPAARAAGPTAPSRRASSRESSPTPPSRAWTEAAKLSSRQASAASSPISRRTPRARSDSAAESASSAGADGDRAEEEAVAGELPVEPLRPLLQRREGHVPGRETDPGADRGDVVEVVVEALELEQQGPRPARFARRGQAQRRLAGERVGDRVGDRAGAAGALGERQARLRLRPLGRALEAAVLVEEPGIDQQDPLADDVEAEVAGLDHPGVDRPDGDVVGALAANRDGPGLGLRRVGDQRAQRLVALERDPVQVVRLALVPVGGGDQVDQGRQPRADRDGPHRAGLGAGGEQRRPAPLARRPAGVGAAEARARGQLLGAGPPPARRRDLDRLRAAAAHAPLLISASTRPEPGSA